MKLFISRTSIITIEMEVAGGAMSHFFINSIKDRPGLAEIGINASARSKLGTRRIF